MGRDALTTGSPSGELTEEFVFGCQGGPSHASPCLRASVSRALRSMTLSLLLQVAGEPDCLRAADPHRRFLLPGLAVRHLRLRPECHPNQTRLPLQHWRRLPHGVSAALPCHVGWQCRAESGSLGVAWSGGLWAEHSDSSGIRVLMCWYFISLGNSIKHKKVRGNSKLVVI